MIPMRRSLLFCFPPAGLVLGWVGSPEGAQAVGALNPERHLKLALSAWGRSPNPPEIGHSFGPAASSERAVLVLDMASLVLQRIGQ